MSGPSGRTALGVLGALVLLAGALPAQVAEPEPIEAGVPARPGDYGPPLDVVHYDIELDLRADSGRVRGRTGIVITSREGLMREATFDFTGLAVTGVDVDGSPVEGWGLSDGRLTVPLDAGLAAGALARITVSYEGTPDDGLILGDNVHGRPTAFVDNWPNRTRFWLPSVDHPSDKATAAFTVHAPAEWKVIANGRLVDDGATGADAAAGGSDSGARVWRWVTDVPHPTYTLVVGAADMVVTDLGPAACGAAPASPRDDGCVEVTTWLFPEDVEHGNRSFRRAVEMVDFFTELVGPYPYEKLAHVQSSTRFGGMENASAIFYAEQAIARGADIEGTVSHETAHQWFGDSVTESDWSDLWLSEGFATYFGALFFEFADGEAALRERMDAAAERYLASPDTLHPVIDPDRPSLFDLLNRNSYQKGGLVLHMLRSVLGDEAFFEGVRTYYRRHKHGTASTADLRAAMEEVSGEDLGWFFHQWLERPGYPVLELETVALEGALEVTLRQVQGEYAPRFRLPLDLELVWEGGSRRERVVLDGLEARWTFDVPAPARVAVDPDGRVLHRLIARD